MTKALKELVAIVAAETGALTMRDADDDSVGWSGDGKPLPMTFGHVRRAAKELEQIELPPKNNVAPSIDEIMEQAQVFASAYSLAGGRFDDGTKFQQSEEEKADLRRMIEALAATSTNVRTVAELPMTAFADAAPQRDESNGEQTILTYNASVGVWDLAFFAAGEEFPDKWFGDTHWIDISRMWPGVIAQVASFATMEGSDA